MARILMAGCGDIGSALGVELGHRGHEVFGLRRRADLLPASIKPVAADLCDSSTLGKLPRSLDTVFYTATPGGSGEAAYRRAYIAGLENLLGVLGDSDALPRRLIYVSSTSVYGQSDGGWIDEDSITEPGGFSGRAVLAGERVAAAAAVKSVSVRFGGIYGPGRVRLLQRVQAGAQCVDDPPQYTNRVHRDDCVEILRHLFALPSPAPTYVAVDDAPSPECEVLGWLAQQLDAPKPRRVPLGDWPRRAGSKRCSNALLRASGYEFRYPTYKDGYAAVVAASSANQGCHGQCVDT